MMPDNTRRPAGPHAEPQAGPHAGPQALPGPYLGDAAADYRHSGVQNAAVYFYSNGTHHVVRSDSQQGNRLPWLRKAIAVSLVALGRHHTRVEQRLPAMRGGRFFLAELDVVWEVTNPVRVAEKQLRDVRILLPELLHQLRGITSRYPISDPGGAMAEINRFLDRDARASISAEYGLDVRVYVQLNLDDAEIEGIEQTDKDERQAQLEEMRRQRLLRTLAGGGLERAAALTAQDPEQLATAIQMLTESEKADRKQMIEFFQYLLDSGAIARTQLGSQAQAILGWVRGGGDPTVPYSIGWKGSDEDERIPPDRAIAGSPSAPPRRRTGSPGPDWLEDDAEVVDEPEPSPGPPPVRRRMYRDDPEDHDGRETFRADPARPDRWTERRGHRGEPQPVDDDRPSHRRREPARTVEVIASDIDRYEEPRPPRSRSAARDDWADEDWTGSDMSGSDRSRPRPRTGYDEEEW